jgi:regulator of extracellular matrix RemA (YlzA/DUF370 family)
MSMNEFQEIGLAGSLSRRRVIAVGRYDSAPIRRSVRQARKEGRLIDLTYGRACRWVYFLDSGHIVLGTQSLSMDGDSEVQE